MTDPDHPEAQPDRDGNDRPIAWRAAFLGVVVIAITIIPAFLTGALGVQIGGDIGIDLAGIGGLYGVMFGTSAVMSAGTGRFVQRRGWETGIRLSAGGTGLALVALAVFPSDWWTRWWPVALVFACAGWSAAVSQAGSNLALAQAVPPERHGLVFGLKHTAVPAAAMLGGLAVPTIALTVGWRWAYVVAAVMAFATMAGVPARGRQASSIPLLKHDRTANRPTTPIVTLVALAVAAALAHTGLDAVGAFIVPYAVSVGVAEGAAGIVLTFGSMVGLIMRLASGWLVDSRQHAGLMWMTALLFLGSAGFLVLAMGGSTLLVLGVLLAFAGGWGWAGLLTFIVVRANPDSAATATGIANTGKYVGAAVGPALVGYLAVRVSFSVAWWIACGALAAAAIIVGIIRLTPAGRQMADSPSERTT